MTVRVLALVIWQMLDAGWFGSCERILVWSIHVWREWHNLAENAARSRASGQAQIQASHGAPVTLIGLSSDDRSTEVALHRQFFLAWSMVGMMSKVLT